MIYIYMLHFLRNENMHVDERKDPGFTTDPLISLLCHHGYHLRLRSSASAGASDNYSRK